MTCLVRSKYGVLRLQIDDLDLPALGPLFERHEVFPARTNTEFVEVRASA